MVSPTPGAASAGSEAKNDIPVQLEAESATQATKLSVDSREGKYNDDGESSLSSKASVSSSLYESIEENGRTYHKYKQGNLQHHICKMSLHDRLFLAPLKEAELKHTLDFGTGTGIWAIEFADKFPNCQVIGSDLSMIQPEMIPQNLSFEIDDIEDTWVYPVKFNFIHGRFMAFAMKSPLSIFEKAFASLAPGGYFEMQDLHPPPRGLNNSLEGTVMARSAALLLYACTKVGMDPTTTVRYKSLMETVGFVDIKEAVIEWPIGTWAKGEYHKKIGAWFRRNMEIGIEGILMGLFTRVLGMSKEEVLKMVAELKKEMRDPKIHAFQSFHIVYGRKPE